MGCIADVLTCPVARTSPFSDENGQIELQGRCSFLSRSQLIIGIIGASKGLILLYALAKKCTPCCHADQPLYARWLRVAVPDLHMEQVNAVEKTRCLQQLATASKGSASHRQRMGPRALWTAAAGHRGLHAALTGRLRRKSSFHKLCALCMGEHQTFRLLLSRSMRPLLPNTLPWATSVYLAVVICTKTRSNLLRSRTPALNLHR